MTATDFTLCALLGYLLVVLSFHLAMRRPTPVVVRERRSALPRMRR